jgi:hypothetical protein
MKPRPAIRAEIVGDSQCSARGITSRCHKSSPVIALCRALIEAGHDPATPLHAYRGDTLCLRIRSIGEAARMVAQSKGGFHTDNRVNVHQQANQNRQKAS